MNDQVAFVAEQLGSIPDLKDGFDAIGFSQGAFVILHLASSNSDLDLLGIGGQFLRAYIERYNNPPIHNLITFGSQHMGVSDIPPCRKYDFICQMARSAAKGAVYSNWAQQNIVTVRLLSY